MVTAKKKTETVVVTLRIKEALRRRLETAATHNEVSVNNEITRRLEDSFARAEQATLTENVDRLSTLYEHARVASDWLERYRQNAQRCLAIAQAANDSENKLVLLAMANSWLALAAQREQSNEAVSPDLGLGPASDRMQSEIPATLASAHETDEERQARLRASADELLKNAKRNEALSAHDLAEPREWDTRTAPPRSPSKQEPQRQAKRAAGKETLADIIEREARRASPGAPHDKA